MNWVAELEARGNIDQSAYVVQKDMDGGDTALHEGHLLAAAAVHSKMGKLSLDQYATIRWRAMNRFALLISDIGLIRRHPDSSKWYGEWNRGSRDQYHAVIGLYLAGLVPQARRILKGHALRLFAFASNVKNNSTPGRWQLPDLTSAGFLSYYVRGEALNGNKAMWLLYPGMVFADLSLLLNSAIRVYWFGKDKNESDIRNHVLALTLAYYSMPTPVSWLARKLLARLPKKFDPESEVNAVQQELNDYYRSNNGVDFLAEVWEPVVKEVIYE